MDKQIANLCEFLDASCSVYHAHAQLVNMLNDAGYTRLCEAGSWNLVSGGKYYVSRGGTALIAQRSGATVIPAYVDEPYKWFRKTEIRFGKPVDLSEFGRKTDAETISRVTDRIEEAIWSLK